MVEASLVNLAELGVLIVGVIIALQQLRDIKETRKTELETRQAQIYMRIYERITDEEMFGKLFELNEYRWDDYEDYLEKYSSDIHVRARRISVVGFFEGLGMLVKRGLIDPVFVADSIGGHVVDYWNKFGPVVEEGRRRSGFKMSQENLECLYNEILKIWEQHPEGFIPRPE